MQDGKGKQKKKTEDEEAGEEDTYYDAMKKDMGDRAARTKVCLILVEAVYIYISCNILNEHFILIEL